MNEIENDLVYEVVRFLEYCQEMVSSGLITNSTYLSMSKTKVSFIRDFINNNNEAEPGFSIKKVLLFHETFAAQDSYSVGK